MVYVQNKRMDTEKNAKRTSYREGQSLNALWEDDIVNERHIEEVLSRARRRISQKLETRMFQVREEQGVGQHDSDLEFMTDIKMMKAKQTDSAFVTKASSFSALFPFSTVQLTSEFLTHDPWACACQLSLRTQIY